MSGFETAVRGGLRFKRHSEALVVDEKRRKKKRRARDNKQDETPPTVAELPPELADDPEAVAAAAAIRAGKTPKEAFIQNEHITTEAQSDPEANPADAGVTGDEQKSEKAPKEGKSSASPEAWRPEGSDDVEALLSETNPHWTQAERAFFLARKARETERIKKQLQLTHRQRMEKFNQHLASLSEHFDQPRVGPG